jgi:hypothetical protein
MTSLDETFMLLNQLEGLLRVGETPYGQIKLVEVKKSLPL